MQGSRRSVVAAITLAVSLLVPAAQPAQAQTGNPGVPGGPFSTAFRVQNLDSSGNANCTYVVYRDDGTQAFSRSLSPIAPGDSAYVFTPSETGFPTGTFAGVVQCDRQVAVVVNFSDENKGDSYVGTGTPRSTLYIPSVYRNYFNFATSLRLQNASNSAQRVTIEYFAPGSSSAVTSTTVDLQPNGAATIEQATVSALQPNVAYSARITGTADLAAMVNIYGVPGTNVANQLYSYSAFGDGSTQPIYVPVIMRNYYGYNTATTIQNIDSSAADVRMTYSNGQVRTFTIPANSSQVVLDFTEETLQPNVLYGAKIESINGKRLIVTVNESTLGTNRATTYEGQAGGGRTLVAPIVMKRYYAYNTSITCQNVGSTATNVRVSYSSSSVNNKLVLSNLAPGATGLIYQPAENDLPDAYIGSATITSDNANIVCVVNQDQNESPQSGEVKDLLGAYNAIIK